MHRATPLTVLRPGLESDLAEATREAGLLAGEITDTTPAATLAAYHEACGTATALRAILAAADHLDEHGLIAWLSDQVRYPQPPPPGTPEAEHRATQVVYLQRQVILASLMYGYMVFGPNGSHGSTLVALLFDAAGQLRNPLAEGDRETGAVRLPAGWKLRQIDLPGGLVSAIVTQAILLAAANQSSDRQHWDDAATEVTDLVTQAEIPELEQLISDVAARHEAAAD